ncbi:hypothetical protein [Nostoc sp.]
MRLKERGIWGVISDTAGAHAIPTLFFAATFLHLSTTPQPESIILTIAATAWSFCAGIRGILLHQLWDRENDLKSGVKTLVTSLDVEKVRFWISYMIFPIEISLLILLVLVISRFAPILLVFFILYLLLKTINIKLVLANAFEPAPTRKANVALHDFYEVWLPLALITLLSIREPLFLILLLLHIILFYPSIKQRTTDLVKLMVSGLKGLTNLVKFTNEYEQKVDFLPTNQQNQQGLEKLQVQLHTSQTEFTKLNSHLQQTQEQLEQIQAKFQQTQGELQQSQSQLHTSQTELVQSQSDLQQTQEQSEQIQAQLRQTEKELAESQSQLHISQTELVQSQSDLQQTQEQSEQIQAQLRQTERELAESQSQLHISQTELVQLKSYLQQTQGVEGVMSYYRSRIASNPDDTQLYHQALTIKPDDAQIHLQLGNALVRQNRFCDAVKKNTSSSRGIVRWKPRPN